MSKRTRTSKNTKKNSAKENANNSKKTNSYGEISIGPETFSNYQEVLKEEYLMFATDYRLKTFSEWPFDEGNSCNPQALAEAGFYHIPSNEAPDAARCFCCYKELDGWEPDDDPWAEHRKHSGGCAFLALKKPVSKLTVEELLKLECARQKNKLRKYVHLKSEEFKLQADITREEMRKINA